MAYIEELLTQLHESLIATGFEGVHVSQIRIAGEDFAAKVEILFTLDDHPGVDFGFRFPAYDDPANPDLDVAWSTVIWANFIEQIRSDAGPDIAELIEQERGSSIVWVPSEA